MRRRRGSALRKTGEKALDAGQNALDDDLHALGRRVHPVGQVEGFFTDDSVQEEGIEHKVVLLRNVRIDAVEFLHVIRPEIARGIHAREHDRDIAAFEALDDGLQVLAGPGRVEPAQHVVGAEFQDHPVGAVRHGPVEPVEAARGRVARHPRIGHLHLVAFGLERPLQGHREGRLLRQVVAGAQAVAEGHEADGPPLRLGCRQGSEDRGDHGGQGRRTRKNDRHERAGLALH